MCTGFYWNVVIRDEDEQCVLYFCNDTNKNGHEHWSNFTPAENDR